MQPVVRTSRVSPSGLAFRVVAPICVLLLPLSLFMTAVACALLGLVLPLTSKTEIDEFKRPYRQWIARSLGFGAAGVGLVIASLFFARPDSLAAYFVMYLYILAVTSCFGQSISNAQTASRLKRRYR